MKVHTRSDGKRYVDQDELVESVVKNMSEPTIDDMLESLIRADGQYGLPHFRAIRAILEQHRDDHLTDADLDAALRRAGGDPEATDSRVQQMKHQMSLEAVRAFVERVEKRIDASFGFGILEAREAMQIELAAMEAEVKE